ncbi:MAG: hypothetical protein LBO74_01805, partial [Candidatus Symbiothrix sp.]|nr:hypothetical protein [Candidatus Symbiothrix sp.]
MKKSTFLLPFAHWSLTTERAQEDVFRALPYKSAGWRTIIRSMVCTLLIGVLMMGAVQNAQANTVQENAVQEDENFQVGENTYETLAAAVSAVPNGGTITLLQDFTTGDDCMLFENKTYTVDFGGHTYTGDGSGDGGGTITIVGGTVTFQNGSVIMTFKDGVALWTYAGNTILKDLTVNATVGTWSAAVYSDGGTTSILSGEYIGGEDAVFRNAGTVTITSGYFKSIYDSARNGCLSGTISMAAGSIIEPAFWNGAKEVTVWPVATAENANFSVGAAYYYTIAQALSAVQEDGTITLLRDLPVSTTFILDANKAYTFDLNNHTLTSAGTVGDIIRIKSG